ncbi:MAG TPA: S46 family peptidase [Planctomycetota bacterium]|nr:S46 family peptidase [Planctomycetota bacterium]
MRCCPRRVILALLFAAVAPAQDELGLGKMWTFERPPLAYLKREYRFEADEQWWNKMRLASLRFGEGASASFVSPQGLILTNHHCVRDYMAKVQGQNDWVRDGFVARDLGDEVRFAGLSVQQLVRMTDVTAAMTRGITDDLTPEAAEKVRERNRKRILAKAEADGELKPQLVKLFSGGIWQLYQYRVFDDVRLVMAPHLQISHFGGDPDNFVYPRYAVDFCFCRAYVDGKPADTSGFYFPWGDGPAEGDLVFLTGNPGSTKRLMTMAQLEFLRDVYYPRVREMIDSRMELLRGFAAEDSEMEKRLRGSILGLENMQKGWRGEHRALNDAAFMARKAGAEEAFRERAKQNGYANALDVWPQLEQLMQQKRALDSRLVFQTTGGCPVMMCAYALLEFGKSEDPQKAQLARDISTKTDRVARALFADHLRRARKALPHDDPYLAAMLGGLEPGPAIERLANETCLGDKKFVEGLLRGGKSAIDACQDVALVAGRTVLPLMERNKAASAALEAKETALGARIAKLLFAVYGNDVSPDATFTLRWSDGLVAGYPYNGTLAPWRTVFHGMFARAAEFNDAPPFSLPREWLLARDRIDMRTPVDFVCTVDSTGGNSGSPVVNRRGELAGLLFDGNIESFANEFLYGERVERSVCVHPQAIVEALRKVYGASRLLREIAR